MKLTKRQRQLLVILATANDESKPLTDERVEDSYIIEEGREVWLGKEKTNLRTLVFFLRNMLIKEESGVVSGCKTYTITSWGERAIKERDFDPLVELAKCKAENRRMAAIHLQREYWESH